MSFLCVKKSKNKKKRRGVSILERGGSRKKTLEQPLSFLVPPSFMPFFSQQQFQVKTIPTFKLYLKIK
jgi:hypothetical protein